MKSVENKVLKRVDRVEVLHLDASGYGPNGNLTRRQWRSECLMNFLKGSTAFNSWQDSWQYLEQGGQKGVNFDCLVHYKDGTKEQQSDYLQPRSTLDFGGHVFEDYRDARGFIFYWNANFRAARFFGYVDFSSSKFEGSAYFSRAVFVQRAFFNDTEFVKDAWFFGTAFQYTLEFKRSTFEADACFRSCTFADDAFFNNTVFKRQCTFSNSFEVSGTKMSNRRTSFIRSANFENVVFKNVGHFEEVLFVNEIPCFLGIDNATTRLEFSDDKFFSRHDRTANSVVYLGRLKRLSDEHGQTDQALSFNALELHAKSGLDSTGRITKLFTWLYGSVSDYGRSFARPLGIYAILLSATLVFALGHAGLSLPAKDCGSPSWSVFTDLSRKTVSCPPSTAEKPDDKLHLDGYRAAFEYTLYRAAGVLDFSDNGKATDAVAHRLFGQPIEPWWMRVWGVFKAIASTALLFLTALGLRNKYRIK